MELWATSGTDKKYFLTHSIQIGSGDLSVSYTMRVRVSYPNGKVDGTLSYLVNDICSRT